jgi:hypothetical protein
MKTYEIQVQRDGNWLSDRNLQGSLERFAKEARYTHPRLIDLSLT